MREALEALDAADAADAAHYQATAAYRSYVDARRDRQRATEEEAMDGLDRERQGSRRWLDAEERARGRRQAGLEARDRFELDEPLLEFAEWVEAGSPERYQAKTPAARRQARLDQPVRQGGVSMAKTNLIPKLPITQLPSSPPPKPVSTRATRRTRCRAVRRLTATAARGYGSGWQRLSRLARQRQPWCSSAARAATSSPTT